MLMHIAMTPRDRFSAPVIEDIAEMEHIVQVNVKRERFKNVQFTRLKGSNKHSGLFHRHDPPPPNSTLLGDCIANLYIK